MAGSKDGEGFLRKVVRFVANPATDWHDLNSRQQDPAENGYERAELKAMIERKRRNDFVRRREFDMLRRMRRDGLTPEQLAALGGSSRLDASDQRLAGGRGTRPGGVKAKIDAIEQQMVGDGSAAAAARRAGGAAAATSTTGSPTEVMPLRGSEPSRAGPSSLPPLTMSEPRTVPPVEFGAAGDAESNELPALPPLPDGDTDSVSGPASAPAVMASGLPPLTPLKPQPPVAPRPRRGEAVQAAAPGTAATEGGAPGRAAEVEVSEAVHDPELDEAVIAFANADFDQCEHALTRLIRAFGTRAQDPDTWLVLFDLYRATGQQQRFESLAVEYAHQFGWSAPQWYSLPQLVADAVADDRPRRAASQPTTASEVGWAAPEVLDPDALAKLRSQTLQMPLPWVFDWSALRSIDAEAATQLSVLCRVWAAQPLEMRWIGSERLFAALQDAAPTGVRDADPAFWLARLDALRLTNHADRFDEAAIDYCVTYEVSPPSWERAQCTVRMGGNGGVSTRPPPMSVFSDVSTTFLETGLQESPTVELASVELSGQLLGDISDTLSRLTEQLGTAPMVSVSCARLIRVDFLAAGDLLNWVLARRSEDRTVQFTDAHRLIALFFSAMGINEHAQVQVRRV